MTEIGTILSIIYVIVKSSLSSLSFEDCISNSQSYQLHSLFSPAVNMMITFIWIFHFDEKKGKPLVILRRKIFGIWKTTITKLLLQVNNIIHQTCLHRTPGWHVDVKIRTSLIKYGIEFLCNWIYHVIAHLS